MIKPNDLKEGDRIVLPSNWPDGGEPRQRITIWDKPDDDGNVLGAVYKEDLTDFNDDGVREFNAWDFKEWETW